MRNFLRDRGMRGFLAVLCGLFLLTLSGAFFLWYAQDKAMADIYLRQQAAIAQRLLDAGVGASETVRLVTGKSGGLWESEGDEAIAEGRALLQKTGYAEAKTSWLPALREESRASGGRMAVFWGISLAAFLAVCGGSFFYQHRQWQRMDEQVRRYMQGDFEQARHEECGEGGYAMLAASVRQLAASLYSHQEAEHESREFLKQTVSDISHQLKTPLAALSMYHEILLGSPEDAETVRKFVGRAQEAVERMKLLVGNLLKMARLDAGFVVFEKQELPIYSLLLALIGAFETRAEMEGKTLTLRCEGQTPEEQAGASVVCDGEWTKEAIGNLIKNALDHTKAGDTVRVSFRESAVMKQILVQDNGEGIHPEDLYHIFKRFYRSRFASRTEGAGLGLPLAKAIIEGQGGSIRVKSAPGSGTTFTIAFPVKTSYENVR